MVRATVVEHLSRPRIHAPISMPITNIILIITTITAVRAITGHDRVVEGVTVMPHRQSPRRVFPRPSAREAAIFVPREVGNITIDEPLSALVLHEMAHPTSAAGITASAVPVGVV